MQRDQDQTEPGDQPPAEHQRPNVDHPDNQTNINQQLDEHGVGGIPLQHHNTDDGCRRVLKNKRLRDSLVEPTGSNFDEAVADDGRKIATMHGASHGQSEEGPDQLAQPDLQSESQPSNSDGESLSEIAKSRISGPTWSTETSATPGLLVYTAEELKRLVGEALEKQEMCHRAVMDVAYQRISERDARHRFLLKTLYDKAGFEQPKYPWNAIL
ncbi:hypothetical protein FCM35_KLT18104 [Carex littledalei]|uniref:Uncharacterized protein n=1 Tax=Carex littledalei TaxID=544730 RepID=A0A833R9Y4_9POAL|nr:hypothetical protein FCM35_KLT18104 [Carex littledalei]